MVRIVSLILVTALAVALWRSPEVDPGTLGAMECHELLKQPVGAAPAAGAEDERPSLGEFVLASSAVSTRDGSPLLTLGGVRFTTQGYETADLTVHLSARRSIIRGLRELAGTRDVDDRLARSLLVEGEQVPADGGAHFLVHLTPTSFRMEFQPVSGETASVERRDWKPPSRLSLLPPVIAILLAVLLRRPVPALFAGVFAAAYLLRSRDGASWMVGLGGGLGDVFTDLFYSKLIDPEKAYIVAFVVVTMAMIGVITKSGGVRGMVNGVAKLASNVRSTRVATWLMGLVVFFDDYASCVLVGTTMRPLSDRFRISREKLAYLVDATAAPVAGLSVFSTWIAYEVSTFSSQLPAAGLLTTQGYEVFLQTLPFRFYCILTIFFAGWVAFSGRDFGPMRTAERRARETGELVRRGGQPMVDASSDAMNPAESVEPRASRAVVPLLTFFFGALGMIAFLGGVLSLKGDELLSIEGWTQVLYAGSGARTLFIGSSLGLIVAVAYALAAGLRADIPRAAVATLRSMGIAIVILYLAWMIGEGCQRLGTANYLTALIGDRLSPEFLPILLFLLAALTAFSTGTSWSTMSILLPLVVGLAYNLGENIEMGGHALMILSIGAVLEGAIFGDHCSPISDTTVLSSTASASDHIDHVRTQIPYAVLTMVVALAVGYMPCALYGWSPWLALPLCALTLVALLHVLGRPSASRDEARAARTA